MYQFSFVAVWNDKSKYAGYEPAPPIDALEMSKLNSEAHYKAADLLCLIENWTVIDPRVRIFHTAVNVALHEMRKSWDELSPYLYRTSAVFGIAPNPAYRHPGYHENWSGFDTVLANYSADVMLLDCCVSDLRTEMQNALLGPLFKNRTPQRKPLDPRYRVVSLNRHKELERYYLEHSSWGTEMNRFNKETADKLAES